MSYKKVSYKPILATLAYVVSEDARQVLLIHRNKRADDIHFGKYNGLGGKIEKDENLIDALKRELFEEAGIECQKILLRGTISWPGFGKNGEDWFGFIFRIDKFSGVPKAANHEGDLVWVPIDKLEQVPMWESDRLWLDKVFAQGETCFHGLAPFESGRLLSWNCSLA